VEIEARIEVDDPASTTATMPAIIAYSMPWRLLRH
jgi:hypothetical protein